MIDTKLMKIAQQKKKRDNKREKTKSEEELKEQTKLWTTLYRRNIHLYATHGLGINLHFFQMVLLYLMSVSDVFMMICSRGLSKSFISALYAVIRCLLYPYSKVVITASTIPQATKMVKNKIEEELCQKLSPVLKFYYDKGMITFKYGDEVIVQFWNGSSILVAPSLDSSRGERATCLIYEECRLLKKSIIDSVFEKMAYPRQPIYLNKPEFKDENGEIKSEYLEKAQSIYLTSARYKSEWFWTTFKSVVTGYFNRNSMIRYNFFSGDIFLAMAHGLKTTTDYYKAKETSSEIEHRIEDLNEMMGEAEDAFFTYDLFTKDQASIEVFVPPTSEEVNTGTYRFPFKPKHGTEIRIVYADFAFSGIAKDNTSIGCLSLNYSNPDRIYRQLHYKETANDGNMTQVDVRMRELYYDYEADYMVIDLRNGGEGVYSNLGKTLNHDERDESIWDSSGFTVCNETELHMVSSAKLDELRSKTVDPNAKPVIIPITASAEFNSKMWIDLKNVLKEERIILPIDELDLNKDDKLNEDLLLMTNEELVRYKTPFMQTTLTVNEAVNCTTEWRAGIVKLSEPSRGTKDRIVSLAYGNWLASELETRIMKQFYQDEFNTDDWINVVI